MKQIDFKKLFGQIMNTKAIIIIFIIGIVLILFPTKPLKEQGAKKSDEEKNFAYQVKVQEELGALLSEVEGVGRAKVYITFEDDGKTLYAQDGQEKEEEKTGEKSIESEKSYVLKNDAGGGQSPLITEQKTPRPQGVLVVAEGAKNSNVKGEIVKAVRAVLGVLPHRIAVLEKE